MSSHCVIIEFTLLEKCVMARKKHLELLQQGIDTWNFWRKQHPKIQPDLRGADLRGVDLSRANLTEVNLSRANFVGANFGRTDLGAMSLGDFPLGFTLSKADLSRADLIGTNFVGTNLAGADLSRAFLVGANLSGANLSGADLSRADFGGINFGNMALGGADLSGADLSGANLVLVDLSRANLRGVNLSGANLSKANLSGADLSNAFLLGANLSEANLSEADLSNADIGWTIFCSINLQGVKGLDTIDHIGPSTIGTNTLVRSGGEIPEIFLRGAGLPDTFIDYVHSLVNYPIKYYTCFISYSTQDDTFSHRLYADLQHHGVRCWFAPEHMKTGDKIRQRIDQSIRLYDKLLLVLSQHSIQSTWVEFEVEAALAKERSSNRLVLFPVRLDNAILDCETSWAAHLLRTRHITNFSSWKQHDAYQEVFTRLLRDLQTSTLLSPDL